MACVSQGKSRDEEEEIAESLTTVVSQDSLTQGSECSQKALQLAAATVRKVVTMPPRRQIADRANRKWDLKSFLKSEYYDDRKYAANLVGTGPSDTSASARQILTAVLSCSPC